MTATEIVRAEAVSGLSEIPGDLEPLLTSWGRHLRAANMSPRTVQSYVEAGRRLDAFLIERGMPRLVTKVSREHVEAFIEELLGRHSPATASNRYRSLQQFFKWLVEEGEVTRSPMANMRPPKLPEHPRAGAFRRRTRTRPQDLRRDQVPRTSRDTALLFVFIDTGARLSEVTGARLSDLDMDFDTLRVLGKGRRERVLPIGRA